MKKGILYTIPPLLFVIYVVIRITRSLYPVHLAFLKNHFTDLIFIPAVLGIAYIAIKLIKRKQLIRVPVGIILFQVGLTAVLFEWYLPKYADNHHLYTADWIDVLMYFLGGVIFWFWQRAIHRL